MRKCHELLPLARPFLCGEDEASTKCEFTCSAVHVAEEAGLMTGDESRMLRNAIQDELKIQGEALGVEEWKCAILVTILEEKNNIKYDVLLDTPDYILVRDQWLDEFQAKLAAEDR